MKRVKLTQGKYALVDDEDFEWLNQWRWTRNWNGYACRNARVNGNYKKTYMHRLINNTPIGMDTDHINRDKLDNRKSNLRNVSRSLNNYNTLPSKANKSGVKGVCLLPNGRWRAYIKKDKKQIALGVYAKKSDAILARFEAEAVICI